MQQNKDVIIVGGGLSGLTLAYLLGKKNINALILEGAPTLGGRIQTIKGHLETPLELGATWFSDMHPQLLQLLSDLDLQKFNQFSHGISLFQTKSFEPAQKFFVPEAEQPSYRIAGGTYQLIEALASHIPSEHIYLNTKIVGVVENKDAIELTDTTGKQWIADKVIMCLPPQQALASMQFQPSFSSEVQQVLQQVQTWMLGSIKFVIEYATPFWREKGFSGMLYSHAGIIPEMYDHSNNELSKFGFTGFLNSGAASYSQAIRQQFVLQQLQLLFGDEANAYTLYQDKVWVDAFLSSTNTNALLPHQNNGHSLLQQGHMGNKLYFSSTECATAFAGYMEGAINTAINMASLF